MDDAAGVLVHAAGLSSQHSLHLGVGNGQPHIPANLFFYLVDAADHPQFQAPAGGGVGNIVVQPHQVHRPAADVHEQDRGFVLEEFRVDHQGGIPLWEQLHILDGHFVGDALELEAYRLGRRAKVLPEGLFLPAKPGKRKAGCNGNGTFRLGATLLDFFGDGCKGQQVVQCGLSLITMVGVYLLMGGTLDITIFVMFLLVGTRIFDPLVGAIIQLPVFVYQTAAGKRIVDLLDEPIMQGDGEAPQNHDISFENVTFGYGKDMVLHNVSASFPSGTMTAIVGPSGSGKSTMLRLIARFYDPQSGAVRFGGIDETTVDPEKLMSKISVVFQDVYLFQDTIGNNIRYGRENATQEEIEAAAKLAHCHDFIMALPDGYDTMVGEGGSTLSGGEKQRISIARAILKDAPVLLLDEATSSLDPENEVEVQQAIEELVKDRTVVMIAHKLKTIAGADQIIVLDQGEVKEVGTHKELMDNHGLYRHLWDIQQTTAGWQIN